MRAKALAAIKAKTEAWRQRAAQLQAQARGETAVLRQDIFAAKASTSAAPAAQAELAVE